MRDPHIIIPDDGQKYGKKRSEHEENLRKDGFQTMNDETLDKLKFLEKRYPNRFIDERWAREVK